MIKIPVRAASRSYSVYFGARIAHHLPRLLPRAGDGSGSYLLASPKVWRACGGVFAPALRAGIFRARILFDDREPAKRLATVERICGALAQAGADRNSVLVAAGGGVVGDVAGFAAASYLRGVRLVHVPTTLVAQVDSAIGGKTGVNLSQGKNLVGAFYQPSLVVVDTEFLRSLPERQFRSGVYEIVKYAILSGPGLFEKVERGIAGLLARRAPQLRAIVPSCISIKAGIVSRDERESGLREKLNLGHTLAHALEAATGYRRYLHGEAVAWGLIFAALLSVAMNRLSDAETMRIVRLVARVGRLPGLQGLRFSRLIQLMRGDKKSRAGRIRWVLPSALGHVERGIEVPERVLRESFQALPVIWSEARRGA